MSARICSSCRRRVRWWQVWMPESRQCFSCAVQLPDIGDVPCVPCQQVPHTLCDSPDYCPCRQDHQHGPEELELRLIRLVRRGVDPAVVDQLWVTRNEAMTAQLERATDLEVKALNEEWLARALPPDPFLDPTLPEAVALPPSLSIDIWPRADGLRSVLLHPVKAVSVVPKVGQEVTVTFRVTRVEWLRTEES